MEQYNHNPYRPPESDTDQTDDKKSVSGLGGWLILVGIGLCLRPFFMLAALVEIYASVFADGVWELLTDPSLPSYVPGIRVLTVGEICINVLMMLFWIWLIVLFFRKKYQFKQYFVIGLIATPVIIILDSWFASMVFPAEVMFDKETMKDIIRSSSYAIIWVSYIKISKRVKNTFVN